MRKYIAETIGTFTLTFAVLLSLATKLPVPTPVIAALTLGLFVYTVGSISGAHLNPAISIGLWSIKKINHQEVILYIIAQLIGANIALLLANILVTPRMLLVSNALPVGIAEAIGTSILAFGVASVVYQTVPSLMSGIVIGGSLLLGILIAATTANGVLNPAVAIGIGSMSAMYLLAPIIGAVGGMQLYKLLLQPKTSSKK